MSTVRIQVRRGTASDWTSVNPILAGGEIGFETNTGKLKIGDGTTSWSSLDYVASDVPAVGEIAMDAINSALTMGSGISKSYDDGADEITLENTGVLSFNTRTGNVTLSANDVNGALGYTAADSSDLTSLGNQTSSDITNAINVAENYTDSAISAEETARNSAIATAKSQAISTANEYTDNSLQLNIIDAGNLVMTPVDSDKITIAVNDNPNFSGTLNANAITVGDITSDGTLTATDINVTGNLTVSGTTTTVDSTNLNITDPMVYLGSDNQSNVLDLGFVGSFNDGTYQHSGLVRDASDGTWKLFSGVVSEPTTTVDFSTYTKDSLQLDGLDAERAKIGDVTNAQIQRLHGVTSNIQDQIDSKASTTYVNQNFVAIESGTLNNPNLQSSSIYNSTISNSELINAQLSGNTTVSDSITLPASSILETNIANGAVTNSKLSTNAVTNAKVANNAAIDYLKLNLEAIFCIGILFGIVIKEIYCISLGHLKIA